jgi:cellulose synthase/poly-beta-1,6-N-acetylglucosamine synthase-like glycosyltransferase
MSVAEAASLHSPFAASIWTGFTDWLTLTLALTWAAAGLFLLFFGWLSLPRSRSHDEAPPPAAPGSTALRIVGGMVLAIGATIAGTYLLGHGSAWDALALTGVGLLAFLGYEWISRVGLPVVAHYLSQGAAIVWAGLSRLFWLYAEGIRDAGTGITIGVARLLHEGPMFRSFVLTAASAIWSDRGYALVNLTALLVTVAVGGFAGWMSSSSRWRTSGVVTFLGLDFLALGLIGFSVVIVENARGVVSEGLGIWLLAIELLGMLLFLAYQFYTLEFLTGEDTIAPRDPYPVDPSWNPTVLVQVASYNEPPEIVERCLESAKRLDYPHDLFIVQLVDDSTDPTTVARLRDFCAKRGIDFRHRDDRRGFKGGALNDGLHALGHQVDLVAIVDSDYEVEPRFLRHGVQPFRDPKIGFVQTPQAYRNAGVGTFARWYALADAYFYRVIQPVRARAQSLIFCGTMGLLRREALEKVGGWSETCVTEDAELSLRLLAAGWRGHYIPTIFGWGLAPDLMSAVRSQHRRWAFGGMQMLRMNQEKLQSAHLSLRQRVDFRMGGLFWVDGLFLVGMTSVLASIVVATWFGVTLPVGSAAVLAVIASAPLLLMADGLVKIRLALRATTPVTIRDTLGIIAFWYAIKINDLRAALRGWWGAKIPFVRTPKGARPNPGRLEALGAALRGSALETSVAVGLVAILGGTMYRWGIFAHRAVSLGSATLLIWLAYYAAAFASALAFDYFSRRSAPGPANLAAAPGSDTVRTPRLHGRTVPRAEPGPNASSVISVGDRPMRSVRERS